MMTHKIKYQYKPGFTLVEILMVVVILIIGALAVIPMISSAASVQVDAAADMLAADLEYAKSLAISRADVYRVYFNESQNYYEVQDSSGNVIEHPVKHKDFTVDFDAMSHLDRVTIDDVDFDGTTEVRFNYLGSPLDGGGGDLDAGTVTLVAGDSEIKVTVEAVTGMIRVNR